MEMNEAMHKHVWKPQLSNKFICSYKFYGLNERIESIQKSNGSIPYWVDESKSSRALLNYLPCLDTIYFDLRVTLFITLRSQCCCYPCIFVHTGNENSATLRLNFKYKHFSWSSRNVFIHCFSNVNFSYALTNCA